MYINIIIAEEMKRTREQNTEEEKQRQTPGVQRH
jgi:hypothetical protein